MANILQLAGAAVTIAWDNATQRTFATRLSKIGESSGSIGAALNSKARGDYAIVTLLWAVLPADVYRRYPTPEDMVADIAPEDNEAAVAAVFGVIKEMTPTPEKKSTSKKSPSRGSNSA